LEKLAEGVGKDRSHKNLVTFLNEIIQLLFETSDLILKRHFNHTDSIFSMVKSDLIDEI